MKRVLCVWFPNWTIQRRLSADAPGPARALVVYSPSGNPTRVTACSSGAHRRGVRIGMPLVEAQSLWPANAHAVRFESDDPFTDRAELKKLADWCQRFSPTAAIDPGLSPDCLLLDATGDGYESGGEARLVENVVSAFHRRGCRALAVVADTVGAAWGVAHYGCEPNRTRIVPPGGQRDALRALPIEALRLPQSVVSLLHELNLEEIGQLLALPRSTLPSRFGLELLPSLDRALGALSEPLEPERPQEPLEASWPFEPAIGDSRLLLMVINHLLERLLHALPSHAGVRQLLCTLKLADHDSIQFSIELSRPNASLRDLTELMRLRVERLRLPTEVVEATLRAAILQPLEFHQDELFGGAGNAMGRQEAAGLLERLCGRLGEWAVVCPRLWPDAQPEHDCRYEPWRARADSTPREPSEGFPEAPFRLPRPVFLKGRPAVSAATSSVPGGPPSQFHWRDRPHVVERAWGPERIETGWWRGEDVRRDYFLVETSTGERDWVYRGLADGRWHLHGVFA